MWLVVCQGLLWPKEQIINKVADLGGNINLMGFSRAVRIQYMRTSGLIAIFCEELIILAYFTYQHFITKLFVPAALHSLTIWHMCNDTYEDHFAIRPHVSKLSNNCIGLKLSDYLLQKLIIWLGWVQIVFSKPFNSDDFSIICCWKQLSNWKTFLTNLSKVENWVGSFSDCKTLLNKK